MAFGPEETYAVDKFNGINISDDEAIIGDSQFTQMDNFFIDTSDHELKLRPGFVGLGQGKWGRNYSYLTRYTAKSKNVILGFRRPQLEIDSLTGVSQRDFDGWVTNQSIGGGLSYLAPGWITDSVFYIDKEYFYGPGCSKSATWSVELSATNLGGVTMFYSINVEEYSWVTSPKEDFTNPLIPYNVDSFKQNTVVLSSDTITLIAAVGSNTYLLSSGTITLDRRTNWVKVSVQVFNSGAVVGNHKLRVKNLTIKSANYSTIANFIPDPEFINFNTTWSRRVSAAGTAFPDNEIVILAANTASQTPIVAAQTGLSSVEIYPAVASLQSSITSGGFRVASVGVKYFLAPGQVSSANMRGGFQTITSSPPLFGVHILKDRVFGFNAEEARLWFSDIGNPESWPTTNFIDIGNADEKITGITSLQDKLIIFKDSSVYFLYVTSATTTWNLRKITEAYGCTSQYTIQHIDGYIYFVGVSGVYRTDGQDFEEISINIRNVFYNRSVLSNQVVFDHAGMWRGHYVVSLQVRDSSVINIGDNTLYVYNIEHQCWLTWTYTMGLGHLGFFIDDDLQSSWGPGLLATIDDQSDGTLQSSSSGELVILPTKTNFNYVVGFVGGNVGANVYLDGDKPYVGALATKSINIDDKIAWKRFKWLDVLAEGVGSVNLDLYVDNSDVAISANQSIPLKSTSNVLPNTTPISSIKYKLRAVAKYLRLVFQFFPEKAYGFDHSFALIPNINGYTATDFVPVTAITVPNTDTVRPSISAGKGYKLLKLHATHTPVVSLTTPFIRLSPTGNTLSVIVDQKVTQAGNTKKISIEYFNTNFSSLGVTILDNNTGFGSLIVNGIFVLPVVTANAYCKVRMDQTSALGLYFYVTYIGVTGSGSTYFTAAKMALYNMAIYLHRMRKNIKQVT